MYGANDAPDVKSGRPVAVPLSRVAKMSPPTRFADCAPALLRNGYSVLPVRPGSKVAAVRGWSRFCESAPHSELLTRWCRSLPDHGAALACGRIVAIDIDEIDEQRACGVADLAALHLGPTPLQRVGQAPKLVLLYRAAESPLPTMRFRGLDVLGFGSYVVGFGIHPATQSGYEWPNRSPMDVPQAELPVITEKRLRTFLRAWGAEISSAESDQPPRQSNPLPLSRHAPRPDHRWVVDQNGKVTDGREIFLTVLVFAAYQQGLESSSAIAAQAWTQFQARADLSRASRSGRPWQLQDALSRARALVRRDKPRSPKASLRFDLQEHGFWTPTTKRAFEHAVNALGAAGKLPPAAVKISHFMLGFIRGGGSCWTSAEYVAEALDVSVDTVKRSRRQLRAARLWTSHLDRGGRGYVACFRPCPEALGADPSAAEPDERVSESDIKNSCEVSTIKDVTEWDDLIEQKGEKNREGYEKFHGFSPASPECRESAPSSTDSAAVEVPVARKGERGT